MKWVSFEYQGQAMVGLLRGQMVDIVPDVELSELLGDLEYAARQVTQSLPLEKIRLRQPIPRPGKILGIGVNYTDHIKESVSFIDHRAPEVQKWFNKQATAANGPYDPVHLPKVSDQLDYEAELVVVIGRRGRHVAVSEAMDMVAGYCCGCDYSVRDWQRASQTMILGKGFDTHAVFGPCLVTPDEIGDYRSLTIRGYVNDELRQSAQASAMRFSIAEQIAHLTCAFTLEAGDVLFTGTPAGVGAGFSPPRWLQADDRVRVEIDGLGRLENRIIPEPDATRCGPGHDSEASGL